jgi:hypothetical protein
MLTPRRNNMAKTMNLDVSALCHRARRYRRELELAASGNVAFMSEHDFRRAKANLNSLVAYLDFSQSQMILDLPEYHGGREVDLGEPAALVAVENESINDMCRLYEAFEVELVNCPSSRMACKFISHDDIRLRSIIERGNQFLDGYIAQILPLDLPETSPSRASVPRGSTGLNPGA